MVTIGSSRSNNRKRPWWVQWLIPMFFAIVVGLFVVSLNLGASVFENTDTTKSGTTTRLKKPASKKSSSTVTTTIKQSRTKQEEQAPPPTQKHPPTQTQQRKFKPPPPLVSAAKSIQRGPSKPLLTYGRFGGRLNNQLFQFVVALEHSTVLNRTLVVPPEIDMVRWTGLVDNDVVDVWDLDDLNEHYDIDWEIAKTNELEIPDEESCKVPVGKHHNLLTSDVEKYKHCKILHIGGNGGLLFTRQNHRFPGLPEHERVAFDIYQRIHPSKTIQKMVDEFNLRYPYELAVHNRVHGDPPYPNPLCVGGNGRVCRPHIEGKLHNEWCDEKTLNVDCAKWTDTDIVGQLKSKRALKELEPSNKQKFVMANDMTHDYNIEFKDQFEIISNKEFMNKYRDRVTKLGGKTEANKELVKLVNSPFAKKLLSKGDNAEFEKNLDRLSQILMEVWTLLKPKWLLGNIFSTFSLAACIMRGEHRKYDSNMCWMLMHPDTQYAIPPTE